MTRVWWHCKMIEKFTWKKVNWIEEIFYDVKIRSKMAWIRQNSSLRLALSLALLMIAHASDICGKCNCSPNENGENFVIYCKSYKNHVLEIDFELIEWPKVEQKFYEAFFNNMTIHLLPKWVMSLFFYVLITKRELIKNLQCDFLIKKIIHLLVLFFLNRMAGDEKIISLNLDDNSIRNVQSNPFEYFTELESISLANNLISELTKGEH